MNPHKIKRKPVTTESSESPQAPDASRQRTPQRIPQPKGPLGRNENVTNVDSTPPFPIMRRGDVMNGTGSPSKSASGPSGPRARQNPSKDASNEGHESGPQATSNPADEERQVAYPPASGPRAPIRNSATTGLTSVHVGVKPRMPGKDTVGQTTVRMKMAGSDPQMNGYDRIPAIPGKTFRPVQDSEEIPGVGVGYGRRKKMLSNANYEEEDKQTAFTCSSATSGPLQSGQEHYKPRAARPTISVEEQAAKYDADYRARLRRAERGRSREDNGIRAKRAGTAEDDAYWQQSMLDDDPRIEGIYTFDYSPSPAGQKGKSRSRAQGEELSRITEYEDPSRPGIVMKSRKYLPPPVDERSYGVPAGRRVRAFAREREQLEGGLGHTVTKPRMTPAPRKGASKYSTFSASSEELIDRTPPPERRRMRLVEERESVTPKASQAPLAMERSKPGQARSNPNMRRDREEQPSYHNSTEEEYEEDEQRFRQKARKPRSEPAFREETGPHARRQPSSYPDNDPFVRSRGVEPHEYFEDPVIPPMPDGEEYDDQTEWERQEAWRQYYAAMQMYATSPMASPPDGMGYLGTGIEYPMMPGMMSNPMINPSAVMNGSHPGSAPAHETTNEIASSRARKVERKHRRRQVKSEAPVPPPKQNRRGKTSSALALSGLITPGEQTLPTPQYGGQYSEGYFAYDPYLSAPNGPARLQQPYAPGPMPNAYNAGADPFAMHAMSAALNGGARGYGMAEPVIRNKRSWYGGR